MVRGSGSIRRTRLANGDRSLPRHRSIGQLQRRSCPLTSALRPAEVSRQFPRSCVSFLPFTRARQDQIRACERNGLADHLPAPPDRPPCAFSVFLEVAGALIFLNRHYGEYEHLTRVRRVAPDFCWESAEPRSGSVYRAIETAWIESTPGET